MLWKMPQNEPELKRTDTTGIPDTTFLQGEYVFGEIRGKISLVRLHCLSDVKIFQHSVVTANIVNTLLTQGAF